MIRSMNNRRLYLLLGLAGLLAAAVMLDRLGGSGEPALSSVVTATTPPPTDAGTAPLSGVNPASRIGFEDFHDVDDRPLFNPSRQRVSVATAGAAGTAVADGLSLGEMVLVGLVASPDHKFAVLQRKSGGRTIRIEQGQDMDGWRLVDVATAEAVFEKDGVRQPLRLFKGSSAGATDTMAPSAQRQPIIPTDAMLGIGGAAGR
jgi:hypothetical protein